MTQRPCSVDGIGSTPHGYQNFLMMPQVRFVTVQKAIQYLFFCVIHYLMGCHGGGGGGGEVEDGQAMRILISRVRILTLTWAIVRCQNTHPNMGYSWMSESSP